MKKSLVSLLVIEGQVSGVIGLDIELAKAGLLEYSREIGYYGAMRVVAGCYKPARELRKVGPDGYNTCEESVEAFRACAERFLDIVEQMEDSSIVKALILHNTASCYASVSGNKPEEQELLNRTALTMLLGLAARSKYLNKTADWRAVYAKAAVGLYEQGVNTFVEGPYRGLIDIMEAEGAKDAAGRRLFLARWLAAAGRMEDAIAVLEPVEEKGYPSASNQVEEVFAYLAELRALVLR